MDDKPIQPTSYLSSRVIRRMGRLIFFFCWIGWSIVAVLLFIGLASNLQQQFSARLFKETDGMITMSNRHALKDEDGVRFYQVDVRYTYSVGDRQYWSNRYSYCQSYAEKSPDKSIIDKYPVGKQVTVYFDPLNPKQSVLSRKISPWSVMPIGLILALLLPAIAPILIIADGILRKIRWNKHHLVGDYPIIEDNLAAKVLFNSAAPFLYAGIFVFTALLLCVVFAIVYLLFWNLNLWTVGLMGIFVCASGVIGIVFAERKLHDSSTTLMIDKWNKRIRFHDPILGGSQWCDFQQVHAIEKTQPSNSSPYELLARCSRDNVVVTYKIVTSNDEKSLSDVKKWLENELKMNH